MNNEEKMLALLEQLQKGQAETNARLDRIENDIAAIKEYTEVTRSATNSLVQWADTVGVITKVEFPIKKPAGL